MIKKYNQIVAYINGNLGDDLFVKILCDRYPKQKFIMCGAKRFKKLFGSIDNLYYVSYDTILLKVIFKINSIIRKIAHKPFINRNRKIINFLSRKVKCNILITGSWYIEDPGRLNTAKMEKVFYESKPYIINCNFGPYSSEEFYNTFLDYFSMSKWVSFRDKYSYDLFKNLDNVSYAPDVACVIDVNSKRNNGSVIISVMNFAYIMDCVWEKIADKYYDKMKEIINYHLSNGQKVYIISFCKEQGDLQIANKLKSEIDSENVIVCDYEESGLTRSIQIMADSDIIYASRFHSMMLGMILGKKVVPFSYSNKMDNVLADLNYDYLQYQADKMIDIAVEEFEKIYVKLSKDKIEKLHSDAEKHFRMLDDELS